jgi:hypothetical protein
LAPTAPGRGGEDEEARHRSGRVVRAMREHVRGTQARELARERGAGKRSAFGLAQDRLATVLFPQLDEMRDEGHVLLEELVQAGAVHGRGGEAVHAHRGLASFLQPAHEHFVRDHALQRALHPAEKLGTGMHAQCDVHVEEKRFAL